MPTWHIPPGLEVTRAELLARKDRIMGVDVLFDNDTRLNAGGDYITVRGRENLRQSLFRRWSVEAGEYAVPEKEDYGAGARTAVKGAATRARIGELRARMRDQALRDPRVESVEEIVVEPRADRSSWVVYAKLKSRGEVITFKPLEIRVGGA